MFSHLSLPYNLGHRDLGGDADPWAFSWIPEFSRLGHMVSSGFSSSPLQAVVTEGEQSQALPEPEGVSRPCPPAGCSVFHREATPPSFLGSQSPILSSWVAQGSLFCT